jgi:hypothetical protein
MQYCRSSLYRTSSPPGLSGGYCVNTILADAAYDAYIYLSIINNCTGSPEFYFWLRRYLRAGYFAGARVYALSRSISSVFREDTLDTTDTVVASLAEVDPSELMRPFPDLNDPDNPFREQESEDDAVATPGGDARTGEAMSGGIRKTEIG